MTHTFVFHDGAETLDTNRAVGLSGAAPVVGIEQTITRYSRAAYKFVTADSTLNYRPAGQTSEGQWDITARDHLWTSFHFYLVSLANQTTVWVVDDGATIRGYAGIATNGSAYVGGVGSASSGVGLVTTGTWYLASCLFNRNGNNRFIVRNADTGATILDISTAAANAAIITNRYGSNGAGAPDLRIDNIAYESSNTLANIDDPVNALTTKYACGLLLPDGAGSYDAWTGTYADVDDVPHDDDTTRRVGTTAQAFTQSLGATSGLAAQVGTIKATMHFAFLKASAVGKSAALRIRSAATDVDTSSVLDIATAAYSCKQMLRTTDPATSSAWTVSGVDSAEVGVLSNSTSIYCTLCGMEILYTITTVDRTPRIAYVFDAWDQQQRIYDEQGRAVPYNEIRPNRWMRLTSIETPTAYQPTTFIQERAVVSLEGVVYTQELGQPPKLELRGAPDDFLPNLLRRIQDSGGGV